MPLHPVEIKINTETCEDIQKRLRANEKAKATRLLNLASQHVQSFEEVRQQHTKLLKNGHNRKS